MITVVAETKYLTKSGLPVSLIGLHGKDELLVVGPTWALLRLAAGQATKREPQEGVRVQYHNAVRTVVEEAFWLSRIGVLLQISSGAPLRPKFLSELNFTLSVGVETCFVKNPLWLHMQTDVASQEGRVEFLKFASVDMLQGMFRCSIEVVQQYFLENDLNSFIEESLKECVEVFNELNNGLEEYDDVHTIWWGEWESKEIQSPVVPNYVTKSGRNITGYPTREESLHAKVPRRYSMHEKWSATVARYSESEINQEIPS